MEKQRVTMIASGYEWECPECGELNKEIEYNVEAACSCGKTFETEPPEHALRFG